MKSKISGEEKHYQKLNSKLAKELKQSTESHYKTYGELHEINMKFMDLECQLELVIKENDMLKSKLNLTDEEVKQIVKSSNYFNDISGVLNAIGTTYIGMGAYELDKGCMPKPKRPELFEMIDQDGKIV